jgi:hypothetical protein
MVFDDLLLASVTKTQSFGKYSHPPRDDTPLGNDTL